MWIGMERSVGSEGVVEVECRRCQMRGKTVWWNGFCGGLGKIVCDMRKAMIMMAAVAAVMAVSSCGNNKGNSSRADKTTETGTRTRVAENVSASGKDAAKVKDDRGYIVKVGDMVPDFDLLMLDGSTVNIKDLRGKVVMLQFTASWCGVCRSEMPHIESDIWLRLKDNPEFALYGIDLKESAETTAEFAKSIPVTYPLTLDPEGERFALFCDKGAGVTRNIILDREGRIIMLTRLYDENEFASMVRLINEELAR